VSYTLARTSFCWGTRRGKVSEAYLTQLLASRLRALGLRVATNVFALGVEIDIIALFTGSRPTVSVIEVKRRPKRKLVEQLKRRAQFSDLVFAAVPSRYVAAALHRIPQCFGVIAVDESITYVARGSDWFGRGSRLLHALGLQRVYKGWGSEALSSGNKLYTELSRSIK